MAKEMKLAGKNLKVLSITRRSLFDSGFVCLCDNCGTPLVNTADVEDQEGNTYTIGLDCKKTLIDKPIMDEMLLDEFMGEYKVKSYKKDLAECEKFLKIVSYPDVDIELGDNEIVIADRLPHKTFEGHTGNIIYMQNVHFLYKIGLKGFIEELYKSGKLRLVK